MLASETADYVSIIGDALVEGRDADAMALARQVFDPPPETREDLVLFIQQWNQNPELSIAEPTRHEQLVSLTGSEAHQQAAAVVRQRVVDRISALAIELHAARAAYETHLAKTQTGRKLRRLRNKVDAIHAELDRTRCRLQGAL